MPVVLRYGVVLRENWAAWQPFPPFVAQLLIVYAKEKAPGKGAYRVVRTRRPGGHLDRRI